MNFEIKYPDATNMEEVREGLIKSDKKRSCLVCGSPTSFVEINYQAYFCSEKCILLFEARIS